MVIGVKESEEGIGVDLPTVMHRSPIVQEDPILRDFLKALKETASEYDYHTPSYVARDSRRLRARAQKLLNDHGPNIWRPVGQSRPHWVVSADGNYPHAFNPRVFHYEVLAERDRWVKTYPYSDL